MTDFIRRISHFGCPLPCSYVGYKIKVSYFHKNSYLTIEVDSKKKEDYFHLFFYYSSLVVEKRVETLVYDIGGFLSAAGGNMGLWLGLSFLTILFAVIDWTKAAIRFCNEKVKSKKRSSVEQTKVFKY